MFSSFLHHNEFMSKVFQCFILGYRKGCFSIDTKNHLLFCPLVRFD